MQRTSISRNRLVVVAVFLVATSFLSGFTFKTILTLREETQRMKKVTGIGGVFFKCRDPKNMKQWY